MVSHWAWENIPNVLGVAWGHLEWWEDGGDAALAWCSLPDLAMDSEVQLSLPCSEEPSGWNRVTGLGMSRHKSVTGCGTAFFMNLETSAFLVIWASWS